MSIEKRNRDYMLRKHKIVFKLNDLEFEAFNKYCKKYRIENKSKFIRETLITAVLERFDRDYPSLFDNLDEQDNLA